MNHVNQVFKEHFGPVKLTDSVATDIVADQERIDEERGRRNEEDKGQWSGLTKKGRVQRNEPEK